MQAQCWESASSGAVICRLCAHACHLTEGKRGKCAVRENRNGLLHTLVANRIISAHVDPIEKKPLYHYLPGTRTFSLGTMGCNFSCRFCQNASISRYPADTGIVEGEETSPDSIIAAACKARCESIAFTYNEPTVFYELMAATSERALEVGLGTIMVSNGFQSVEALEGLRDRIQAVNIDLKGFTDTFYKTYCGARLQPVLDNLKRMVDMGWWVEVTTLLIPGLNDTPEALHGLAGFIRKELGKHVPWHLSAFHPCYQMVDRPATSVSTVLEACAIGREEGLVFVYPGNVPVSTDTCCPSCGAVFIRRDGWKAYPMTSDAVCRVCGAVVPGIWSRKERLVSA